MLFKSLTAAAALAALASPALAQTPEAQLTTPPPADEAQAAPAPQGQQAAPQGEGQAQAQQMTEEQRQQIQQYAQTYLVLLGMDAYADRCDPFPAAETVVLEGQIQSLESLFTRLGADLSEQREGVMTEVGNAECGAEDMQTAYDALSQQLSAPVDTLVLGFDEVEASCRNRFLETDDASFAALVEERKTNYEGELPEPLTTGATETATAISNVCAQGDEQQIATLKQGMEVRAVQAALSE